MNFNRKDLFTIIAIVISLGVPVLGSSYVVLNKGYVVVAGLNESISELNTTVAVLANISEQNAKIGERVIDDVNHLKDREQDLRIEQIYIANEIALLQNEVRRGN